MINRRSFIKSVGAGAAAMLVPPGLTQAAIGKHTNVTVSYTHLTLPTILLV